MKYTTSITINCALLVIDTLGNRNNKPLNHTAMINFNLNDYILVQITEYGMTELRKQVGQEYINVCITPNKKIIDGVVWHKLQAHEIPSLFGRMLWFTHPCPINSNILVPTDEELINL